MSCCGRLVGLPSLEELKNRRANRAIRRKRSRQGSPRPPKPPPGSAIIVVRGGPRSSILVQQFASGQAITWEGSTSPSSRTRTMFRSGRSTLPV
jgi:hypothetical protein